MKSKERLNSHLQHQKFRNLIVLHVSKTFIEKFFSFHFRRVKFLLLPTLTEKIVVLTKLSSSGNLHSYEKNVNQFFEKT